MNVNIAAIGQAQEEERKKAARAAQINGTHTGEAHSSEAHTLDEAVAYTKKAEAHSFLELLFGGGEKRALRTDGLPPEIAGKSLEDALVFLKDNVTMAGDELAEKMTDKSFQDYRMAVRQLTKFVVKKSFEIAKRQATRGKRRRTVYTQIDVINKKLNELAAQIFLNQKNKFAILSKTEEIAGLIVDMLF